MVVVTSSPSDAAFSNLKRTSTLELPSTLAPNSPNTQRETLLANPAVLDDTARNIFLNDYLNDGGANGINGANTAWKLLPSGSQQLYKDKALDQTT